jgi:steroid delta-isomerase-like uncharacterized protein
MVDNRVTLIHEWFEQVWNRGDASAVDRLMAADAVIHGLRDIDGSDLRGRAHFLPFFRRYREAFPDLQVIVEDVVSEGDTLAGRCVVRGTHRGHTLGFAATNRPVEFTGMCFARVRNGQIVETWNNFDLASMVAQLQPA